MVSRYRGNHLLAWSAQICRACGSAAIAIAASLPARADICSCTNWPVEASGAGICAVRETQTRCSITFAPRSGDRNPASVEEKVADTIAKGDEQKRAEIERVTGLFYPVDNDFLEVMRAADDNTVCQKFGCSVLTVSQLKNLIENEIAKRKNSEHKREVARQDTINILIAIGTGVAALVSLIGLWFSWRRKDEEREGQDSANQQDST